jgi:hypothetical protein
MAKTKKQTIYNGQNEETDNLQWPKRGNRQSTMTKTRKHTIYNGQNEETDNLQYNGQNKETDNLQ